MSKERKLTAAEERRKAAYEKICEEYQAEGYIRKEVTTTAAKANIYGILTSGAVALPFVIGFVWLNIDKGFHSFGLLRNTLLFLLSILALTVIHELIHGLFYSLACKSGFSSIEFGIVWEMLTPYCTCAEPMNKKGYLIALLMPGIILGVIPALITMFTGNVSLFALAVIMILGAGGDLLICYMILKGHFSIDAVFLDHPYEVGTVVFEK